MEAALREPGIPLEAAARRAMESHFAHDFSRVRIHSSPIATQAARAVGAQAYTVGQDIFFSEAAYSPTTAAGRDLLAHELAHTLQRRSAPRPVGEIQLGRVDDPLERQAERAPGMASPALSTDTLLAPVLRRQTRPDAGVGRGSTPRSAAVAGTPTPVVNRAGQALNPADRDRIAQLLGASPPAGPALAFTRGPQFVIHDTAGEVGAGWIAGQVAAGRGPLGEAAVAYVPRTGPEVIARPTFFDPRRPAGTQFERANDLMSKPLREDAYRAVWQASSAAAQTAALATALAGLSLTQAEVARETTTARTELGASSGMVHTTGSWVATELCSAAADRGVPAVAASAATVPVLTAACARLTPVMAARRERLASTVNVETVQARGSVIPGRGPALPTPAYTDDQYAGIARVYLRAALQAGRWPEITTHYVVDRGVGDHVDPRCFDLGALYRQIAALMGHPSTTRYGIQPLYGSAPPSNVWWDRTVCGSPAPS
ncbi:MAG: DUF4157 domain-containing protein [Actinomycetota bacterium]|nr:DUF4157 domain-containing protein [Actinomycetota bacterium]